MIQKLKYWFRAHVLPDRLFLIQKSKKEPAIYLTFDDGPVPGITDPLLDLLAKYQAKATFFILGKCGVNESALMNRIVAEGHTLANHSYNHKFFTRLSAQQQKEEIVSTNQVIESHLKKRCRWFRAPQGRWDFKLYRQLLSQKMTGVHWSRDSLDFKNESVDVLVDRFKQQPIENGDIVLFHDDNKLCIDALEQLIPYWQSQGIQLKALEE